MAKTTFVATAATGEQFTRSSDTMRYTHALLFQDKDGNWGVWSWHQTREAGAKAQNSNAAHSPRRVHGNATLVPVQAVARKPKGSRATGGNAERARRGSARPAAYPTAQRPDLAAAEAAANGALEWIDGKGVHTARGAAHVYRVRKAETVPGLWYADQRGLRGAWVQLAGACATQRQAESLAQRFENGERHLGHRKLRGVPYAELPTAS